MAVMMRSADKRLMRHRILPIPFILGPAILCADLAFDLRETVSGHPHLVLKTTERTSRVSISAGRVARAQFDFVRIEEPAGNLVTLIDHRGKRFATARIDEAFRKNWTNPRPAAIAGVRMEAIQTGVPGEWNGSRVKRDVIRVSVPGAPGPGDWTWEMDIAENPPGFEGSKQIIEFAAQRKDQDILAMINTLAAAETELLGDASKVRERQTFGIPVHSIAEFRLRAGSPVLAEIGQEYAGYPVMTLDAEVENFTTEADARVFFVPPGYVQLEFPALARERAARAASW